MKRKKPRAVPRYKARGRYFTRTAFQWRITRPHLWYNVKYNISPIRTYRVICIRIKWSCWRDVYSKHLTFWFFFKFEYAHMSSSICFPAVPYLLINKKRRKPNRDNEDLIKTKERKWHWFFCFFLNKTKAVIYKSVLKTWMSIRRIAKYAYCFVGWKFWIFLAMDSIMLDRIVDYFNYRVNMFSGLSFLSDVVASKKSFYLDIFSSRRNEFVG